MQHNTDKIANYRNFRLISPSPHRPFENTSTPTAPENEFTYDNKLYGPPPAAWGIRLFVPT